MQNETWSNLINAQHQQSIKKAQNEEEEGEDWSDGEQ